MSSNEPYIKPLVKGKTIYVDGIIASLRGGGWVGGDVNIADRIFTTNMVVTILGDGIFKITVGGTEPGLDPSVANFLKIFRPVSKVEGVRATIDGVEYSGKNEIVFDKGNITIDGVPATPMHAPPF